MASRILHPKLITFAQFTAAYPQATGTVTFPAKKEDIIRSMLVVGYASRKDARQRVGHGLASRPGLANNKADAL